MIVPDSSSERSPFLCRTLRRNGFALIITITMMILLSLLAVGLLSLSTLSMATSSRGLAMAEARANARLALDLAIAQIQKQTGPDQRVTVPADQRLSSEDGGSSSASYNRKYWTGVYRSWLDTEESRPEPTFLSWLVSGNATDLENPASADQSAASDEIELVGSGTLGDASSEKVSVPVLRIARDGKAGARIAWWAGDQSIKAAISTPSLPDDNSLAAIRTALQSAPRNAVELADTGNQKPFKDIDPLDERIAMVTDWQQSAFLASNTESPKALFHDLAPYSTGLLTNVRAGGFRKDLSMALEGTYSKAPKTPLYTVGREEGINLEELWTYYNLYKELRTRGRGNFTTGGRLDASSPFLTLESTAAACQNDEFHHFKQPVIISYQLVLSFETRQVTVSGRSVNRLHVVADPIITFWNPLDVPVMLPRTAFMSIKYWQIPYDFFISVNGSRPRQCPMVACMSPGDSNYLSIRAGELEELVFKPGEVIKVSQSGNTIVRGSTVTDHNLAGRSGFNYGGGVSLPVRDNALKYIDLGANDTITYEARANHLTCGATGSSGNVLPGYSRHSRHFSITHHEVYVGTDRGTNSLGIGGMYVDWDFGNKRLQRGETRGDSQPGSKPSNYRMFADGRTDMFVPIESKDTRPLSVAQLNGRKSPFMMLSYSAKTEFGSDLGTKALARFNPKAFHVDFYDISQQERDMLPYELSIEPLISWKNRNLEVSTNGNAYFGGGMNAEFGQSFVTTHSVPREPIVSLAALQHSFANGFLFQKPPYGYATLNVREPMLPQISHAIGNSLAPSVIEADQTQSIIAGSRLIVDHSYLANKALWDDWFFSGIAPQNTADFSNRRAQKIVAQEFFDGEGQLPVARYLPNPSGQDTTQLMTELFTGSYPSEEAIKLVASLIRVDGAFNVNSTSVEAWKAILGGLKGRPIVTRDEIGAQSMREGGEDTPVANLHVPNEIIAKGSGNIDVTEPGQWTGRRSLNDDEIDALARALVKQVRKRGPFLSLGDFVNRRLGYDKTLARAGAVQSALDSPDADLNSAYTDGTRAVSASVASRFAFPEAEEGALSYGAPGIIKQADILTPIAPILTVRSDSFIIRAYGESVDASGVVRARAYCEATVERDRNFMNTKDEAETPIATLSEKENETFGRRYMVKSFRWLNPEEV